MNFKKILILLFIFTTIGSVQAQRKVVGKVAYMVDSSNIAGVNISTFDGAVNTTSNQYGIFEIMVPENTEYLIFSFTGMNTEKVFLNEEDVMFVFLVREGAVTKEIVTTAFGIKQDKKSLGYSVQEMKGENLARFTGENFINSLSGKAAGIQTISSSGGIGASARVTIRGCNSFFGNNQPLFVLDGIPIDNRTSHFINYGYGDYYYDGTQGVDYGNSASDINLFDIESVSILKGANAAALYGSRAANGVIILNTKTGVRQGNRLGVTYSMSASFEKPYIFPKFQNKYGQGNQGEFWFVDGLGNGTYDGTDESWGPLLDGAERSQFFGMGPWVAHPDNWKDVMETGTTLTNYIALNQATENTATYFSFGNYQKKGIFLNNFLDKNTIFLKSSARFGKLFTAASFNYINLASNRMGNGNSYDNVMYQFIWSGRQVDYSLLRKHYENEDGSQFSWNYLYHDNPFWTFRKKANELSRDRFISNINVKYDFTS